MVEPTDEEIDHICAGCENSVRIGKGILEGPCYNSDYNCPCDAFQDLERAVEEWHNEHKTD